MNSLHPRNQRVIKVVINVWRKSDDQRREAQPNAVEDLLFTLPLCFPVLSVVATTLEHRRPVPKGRDVKARHVSAWNGYHNRASPEGTAQTGFRRTLGGCRPWRDSVGLWDIFPGTHVPGFPVPPLRG